jgi:hypothetical protein
MKRSRTHPLLLISRWPCKPIAFSLILLAFLNQVSGSAVWARHRHTVKADQKESENPDKHSGRHSGKHHGRGHVAAEASGESQSTKAHREEPQTVSHRHRGKRNRSEDLAEAGHSRGKKAANADKGGKKSRLSKRDRKEETVTEPKEPSEEVSKREQDAPALAKAYSLYDTGTNQRLLGNFGTSISNLLEAKRLFHTHADKDSPMEGFASFELAQAAEGANSNELAKQSYRECISLRPNFIPAYVRLSRLEAKDGNIQAALEVSRQASMKDPGDSYAHMLEAALLEKAGSTDQAKAEKQRALELTTVKRAPQPVTPPANKPDETSSEPSDNDEQDMEVK